MLSTRHLSLSVDVLAVFSILDQLIIEYLVTKLNILQHKKRSCDSPLVFFMPAHGLCLLMANIVSWCPFVGIVSI